MEKIRYGIIGSGMMGCEHLMNIRLMDDAEVGAIADPNETSRSWGRSFAGDAVPIHSDYHEVLRDPTIDAVVVSTPNYTHFNVLEDVFRSGKHVLVEKPLCTRVEDCLRVIERAEHYPGVVWVGMEYRYMRAVGRLIEEARAEAVGRLWMLAIREHRFPFLPKVGDWNRFNRNTGGTLVEKCCHFFDLMNLILARRPLRVYASGGRDVNHLDEVYDGEVPDIIDNAYTIVDYEGGARAMLDLCMFAEGSRHEVEIAATGERGKIEAFEPADELVISYRNGAPRVQVQCEVDPNVRHAGAHHGSTYFEHRAFLDAIRDGRPASVTVRDGALAVAVGAAAERSIALGRPVDLAELGF